MFCTLIILIITSAEYFEILLTIRNVLIKKKITSMKNDKIKEMESKWNGAGKGHLKEALLINLWEKAGQWKYNMRRSMQEILPGIYLGPYASATKSQLENLKSYGITHIICVRSSKEAHLIKQNFPEHFTYLVLEMEESPRRGDNILQHFAAVREFIERSLGAGGKVLVHSNTGNSRSPALLIGYIMEKYQVSLELATDFVLSIRVSILPQQDLLRQLREFEAICAARQVVGTEPLPEAEVTPRGIKRTIDEV